jgi:HPr kinase/phosphorylase
MRFHASCGAKRGPDGSPDAVLLTGAAGTGKSDLLLRLLARGWLLVADDQVLVEAGIAQAPIALAGMLEVRGLGLFKLQYCAAAPLRLVARLGVQADRLPLPARDEATGLPAVMIDAFQTSAPERLAMALDAACGRVAQVAGAFQA